MMDPLAKESDRRETKRSLLEGRGGLVPLAKAQMRDTEKQQDVAPLSGFGRPRVVEAVKPSEPIDGILWLPRTQEREPASWRPRIEIGIARLMNELFGTCAAV